MLLNRLEFVSMDNPIRRFIQNHVELPRLRSMTALTNPERVLELGCGTGYGTRLIRKFFKAKQITGIDLDPAMIEIARHKSKNEPSTFQVEGAEELSFGDDTFDAVFDFGVIHHIPNWQGAIVEIHRVLKPGGIFILEDLSNETFTGPIGGFIKRITDHPYSAMYSQSSFEERLNKTGFVIENRQTFTNFGLLRYFSIVARKK